MSYPRLICYVPLRSLREKNLIAKVTEGGKDSDIFDLRISTDYVRLRTFGDIRTDYKNSKLMELIKRNMDHFVIVLSMNHYLIIQMI